jgi:hypothetical protein
MQGRSSLQQTTRKTKLIHAAGRRNRIDDNLSRRIRPGVDYTDVNSINRSKDGTNSVTGDDFGKVKLFNLPCNVPKGVEQRILW